MKYLLTIFSSLLLITTPVQHSAQDTSSYEMEALRAGWMSKGGHSQVVTVFKVKPIVEDFKLILSMRVGYDIGEGEQVIDIEQEGRIQITVYGNDVKEKGRIVYEFVKDRVDLEDEGIYLLKFSFVDISTELIDKMSIRYGLWEGEKAELRNEQLFEFEVEDLNRKSRD